MLVVTGIEQKATLPHGRPRYVSPGPTPEADLVCVLIPRGALHPRRQTDDIFSLDIVYEPLDEEQWFWQQLVRISATIGRQTHPGGGVLLHSGLAAYPGQTGLDGILLAGRSGVGKSTASKRLPLPWHSLADDLTLLVHDAESAYWAHPWPTWSWFFGKEDYRPDGGVWDMQQAVPLRAIFFLEQGEEERAEPMGPGHAACLLAELAQQTSRHLLRNLPLEEIAAFNLQRFDNLCALAKAVPAYLLYVRLDGEFWKEIEKVMQPERLG